MELTAGSQWQRPDVITCLVESQRRIAKAELGLTCFRVIIRIKQACQQFGVNNFLDEPFN